MVATTVPLPGARSEALDNDTVKPLVVVGTVVVKAIAPLKLPKATVVSVNERNGSGFCNAASDGGNSQWIVPGGGWSGDDYGQREGA
jgi:hypothetical protein